MKRHVKLKRTKKQMKKRENNPMVLIKLYAFCPPNSFVKNIIFQTELTLKMTQ